LRAPATAAAARIVLCLPFWWSGLSKLLDFSGGTAEMAALGLEPAWLSMHSRSSSSSADRCR
jgi:transmembrane protein